MATLNRMLERIKNSKKIIVLFLILSVILLASGFSAGGLIALALWLQVYLKLIPVQLTRNSQVWAFKVFLCAIPLLLFWGSVHSFVILHFQEQHWLFFMLSFILDAMLIALGNIQIVWLFQVAEISDFKLDQSFKKIIPFVRFNQKYFYISSLILFVLSFLPIVSIEWKILFALIATQLTIFHFPLKPVNVASGI